MRNNDLSTNNFFFDISRDPMLLGRLRLPYRSFNFLGLLSKQYGQDKYDNGRDLIELCQWMYIHVSDVRNIINRLAEYVVTDFQIDNTYTKLDKDQQENLLKLLKQTKLKETVIKAAKTYLSTGNIFASVDVGFKKHLQCPRCQSIFPISKIDYIFDIKKIFYTAKCYACKKVSNMNVIDTNIKKADHIKLRIWDWHNIEFSFNPMTEEYQYYYAIPKEVIRLLDGKVPDKHLLETTPHYILKEIFSKKKTTTYSNTIKQRLVVFNDGKLKHIKNPSTMDTTMGGWGEPITVGVLQDVFFMLMLRQAQAVILGDYIVPIRVVSPDPSVMSSGQMFDLKTFSSDFDEMYNKFQYDKMQIMKAPYPIQYQTLSGEGKSLFLANEMESQRQAIRKGMGVPAELLDGGLQNFSAGQISLRMLENFLINLLNGIVDDITNNFFIPEMCKVLGMEPFKVNFAKFKMLDDIQQKQMMMNLYDRNLITDMDVYDDYNKPRPSESELLESIERKARRDAVYMKVTQAAAAESQAMALRKQQQTNQELADLQEKDQEIKALKGQSPDSSQSLTSDGMPLSNKDDKPVISAAGEELPPPQQYAQMALEQLGTQEELETLINKLRAELPSNKDYVDAVQSYIEQNFMPAAPAGPPEAGMDPTGGAPQGGSQSGGGGQQPQAGGPPKMPKQNVTNSITKPKKSDGGVDMRPIPGIKPPRR
mgnify:CR=1 FL=1